MKINRNECIGCGVCMEKYPELFVMENGKAQLRKLDKVDKYKAQQAAHYCTMGCIFA